ncbi:choice-of-anchor P family protein [Paracidobacterium acidisoli]|uniref:Uncharacterized protein n=1 Tax=Paracidobacterium acidisoli TaxID=2303751 RepID=A0A372IS59_9BACT|nr:choice-of-anchor P family protein [Paracidobacterium acidisoli]MBT9330733.1 hypothetical protein [Paracidobacterium acidisoli]
MATDRVHYYHADGNALGGTLNHPLGSVVPSQAELSLPAAGGFTSKRTGNFNYGEIVRIENAYTHALGSVSDKNGNFTTLISSVVEGLNILEIVTADRIVAQISVEHPRHEKRHPKVNFIGSQYVNLRIAGQPIIPKINPRILTPAPNLPDTAVYYDREFRKAIREQHKSRGGHETLREWIHERYGWVESEEELHERGYLHCSLVDTIYGEFPGETYGHCVNIPDVGKFYFGEVVLDQNSYRVIMLQAELGCPVSGKVSVATGGVNGSTSG